jgi:hypothetical protein
MLKKFIKENGVWKYVNFIDGEWIESKNQKFHEI